jgi:hypothetical protein
MSTFSNSAATKRLPEICRKNVHIAALHESPKRTIRKERPSADPKMLKKTSAVRQVEQRKSHERRQSQCSLDRPLYNEKMVDVLDAVQRSFFSEMIFNVQFDNSSGIRSAQSPGRI